jgi:prepilin-type processing-associated H-X9-DG protein
VSAIIGEEVILQTSYGPNATDSFRAEDQYGYESNSTLFMFEEIWDKGVLVDNIKRPAGKLLFTDAIYPVVTYANDQGNYVNHWDEHGEIFGWELQGPGEGGPEPMYRHSEGANVAFCDGHVEYLKKTEMFYFTDGNRPNLAATNVDVTRNDRLWCYFK